MVRKLFRKGFIKHLIYDFIRERFNRKDAKARRTEKKFAPEGTENRSLFFRLPFNHRISETQFLFPCFRDLCGKKFTVVPPANNPLS